MGKSRLEMRRQAEAAVALDKVKEAAAPKKERKTKERAAKDPTKRKATTRKTREKPVERKRAVWIIYSGSMKEEGRYPYDQKQAAEERLEALRARGKRLYFLQMVKELITSDAQPMTVVPQLEDEPVETDGEVEAGMTGDVDEMVDLGLDASAFTDGEEEEEEKDKEEEAAGEEE